MRPTFYYNNVNPIRACGVLFYRKNTDLTIDFLMIKKFDTNYFEDIGGKTDKVDICLLDTLIREVKEETNNKILLDLTDNNVLSFYSKNGD